MFDTLLSAECSRKPACVAFGPHRVSWIHVSFIAYMVWFHLDQRVLQVEAAASDWARDLASSQLEAAAARAAIAEGRAQSADAMEAIAEGREQVCEQTAYQTQHAVYAFFSLKLSLQTVSLVQTIHNLH